jgi:hypothetical protein
MRGFRDGWFGKPECCQLVKFAIALIEGILSAMAC